MDKFLIETHAIPWKISCTDRIFMTPEAFNKNYFDSFAEIKKNNPEYDRLEFSIQNICVLSSRTAFVSGYNTPRADDDSIIRMNATVYIMEKIEAGWRINSFAGKGMEKIVSC